MKTALDYLGENLKETSDGELTRVSKLKIGLKNLIDFKVTKIIIPYRSFSVWVCWFIWIGIILLFTLVPWYIFVEILRIEIDQVLLYILVLI